MTTWALVLAAGTGRRFGGDKLHAPFRGRPILSHCLETVRRALAGGTLAGAVVVHREGDAATIAMAESCGCIPVPVRDSPPGLRTSLHTGLARLASERGPRAATAALILPADQPLVRDETIRVLVREGELGGATVLRPLYQLDPGTPGHPVWIARALWPLVSALRPDEGFARLARERGETVKLVPVPGRNPDVDTLDALAALERAGEG
jgi:molybdenum cofactor cytidylyltransferase